MKNPYLDLTEVFNQGRLRALISSGQAALEEVLPRRPLLARIGEGREALDEALDRERRAMMRSDDERLARYRHASAAWASLWPELDREIADLPLAEAHRLVTARAEGVLPFEPPRGEAL